MTMVLVVVALGIVVAFVAAWCKKNDKKRGWILGIIAAIAMMIGIRSCVSTHKKGQEARENARAEERARIARIPPPEYPLAGEGHAKAGVGIKAYLDPKRTYTRPSGPAKYVFAEDTSLFFDDVEGHVVDRTPNRQKWQEMPEGKYIVYPLVRDDIYFKWWQ